jgi:hypothetical protein
MAPATTPNKKTTRRVERTLGFSQGARSMAYSS